VLVSEFMLQQTTAAVVARRFPEFLARFPDPARLAMARPEEILHAWQGLGYYRRARHLQACARAIVEQYGGRVPDHEDALARLPGIGPYTAAAVAAIAFGRPAVPVDGNVARVLARFHALPQPPAQAKVALRRLAQSFAAPERAGDLAQALIELGALVCRPRRPACGSCPLRPGCQAFAAGDPEAWPKPMPAKRRRLCRALAFVAIDPQSRVLLGPRPGPGPLQGLFVPPLSAWQEGQPQGEPPFAARWQRLPGELRHVFTHIDLRIIVHHAALEAPRPAPPGTAWYRLEDLAGLALPALTRKLLSFAGYSAPAAGRQASAR
jgi:A/G-specific adenine glycosylase